MVVSLCIPKVRNFSKVLLGLYLFVCMQVYQIYCHVSITVALYVISNLYMIYDPFRPIYLFINQLTIHFFLKYLVDTFVQIHKSIVCYTFAFHACSFSSESQIYAVYSKVCSRFLCLCISLFQQVSDCLCHPNPHPPKRRGGGGGSNYLHVVYCNEYLSIYFIYRRPYARRALTHFGLMPEGP